MKNKIQLSESEKKEILYQHYRNSFGWIMEDLTSSTVNNQVQPTQQQPTQQQPTQQQPTQQQPTQQQPLEVKRWMQLKNEGKNELALQVRINEECPKEVLFTILEKYPKAREGSFPNFKLKEDAKIGKGTLAAAQACKSYFGKSQVASAQTASSQTTITTGPKIGEPLTANDIATLVA